MIFIIWNHNLFNRKPDYLLFRFFDRVCNRFLLLIFDRVFNRFLLLILNRVFNRFLLLIFNRVFNRFLKLMLDTILQTLVGWAFPGLLIVFWMIFWTFRSVGVFLFSRFFNLKRVTTASYSWWLRIILALFGLNTKTGTTWHQIFFHWPITSELAFIIRHLILDNVCLGPTLFEKRLVGGWSSFG